MQEPHVILFAGVPGSGKSLAINYLSTKLNLPVFSNDALRDETHFSDMSPKLDVDKFEVLRKERLDWTINKKRSFIYDASIDRRWPELKKLLTDNGYSWKIVSFDLSESMVNKLRQEVMGRQPTRHDTEWLQQHTEFTKNYGAEVGLAITDSTLPNLIVELDRYFQL